ncbi:RHS domain-containing protein [Comamonas piscis]|uniref:RHS domain-containing protein n=1 Tax=Comamonas piscis TaxID=1562974 RepID=A0A7G5EL64_9BURK|nr:RHS repeat-associated core domain-containing protein [Comamonas piscis]QMV74739.1 RHS domain-containing protein [Comamonas piscis]WSO33205.1 RHS repeat-associated core domain-containing protein [Comamonas piscis]
MSGKPAARIDDKVKYARIVNFERDALHREIHRQVLTDIKNLTPGETTAKPLYRKLGWDAAGRMETMQWMGLEQGSALDDMLSIPGAAQGGATTTRVPQTLLGAMSARQYYYDSLGQMVGMRSHAGISRFAYDAAGRLTGAHTPHAGSQRWQFDPAGNRLPIAGPDTKPVTPDAITGHLNETDRLRAQQRAAAQANPITKEQLLRSDFHPLQADPDPSSNQPLHTSKRWAGNRVAYYENQEDASSQGAKIHYQYDSRGNRTQSLDEATGRKLELTYDSGNQLVQVVISEKEQQTAQQYRYDAFGRRLVKYNIPANSAAGDLGETAYFGWDGDRLIHTERYNGANVRDRDGAAQPEIIHTIYEPGSFTPLIQLRRASKAEPDLGDALLANTSPGVVQDALRSALADIKALNASLPQNIAYLSMSKDVQAFMREQLQDYEQTVSAQRKEAAEKVEIRHYLCDHLGTPNALIREDSRLDWAVQLDAWGNVRAEHNPGDLYQPIRLPGQHADGVTGLYYNRHRYYDSGVGWYISQDPIGLMGGININIYPADPTTWADPLGLVPIYREGGIRVEAYLGPQAGGLEHARHGPGAQYHVHVYDEKGNYVRMGTENWTPLTKEDEEKMKKNKKIRDFCKSLSSGEQKLLDRANRQVFHRGHPTINQSMRLGNMSGARAAGRFGIVPPVIRGGGQ